MRNLILGKFALEHLYYSTLPGGTLKCGRDMAFME